MAMTSWLLLSGCDQFDATDGPAETAGSSVSQPQNASETVSQSVEKTEPVTVDANTKRLPKSLDLSFDKSLTGSSAENEPLTESRQGVKMGDVFAPKSDQGGTHLSGKVLTKEGDEIPLENSVDGVSFGFETKM